MNNLMKLKRNYKNKLNRKPSEFEVINHMYMATNLKNKEKLHKLKTKEILIAMLLDSIKYNPESLINQHKFISDAQVPKTKISHMMEKFQQHQENLEFPLLTSKNAFYGLTHLVRTKPITTDEMKQNMDYRHLELQNVTTFLELLITSHIKTVDGVWKFCKY